MGAEQHIDGQDMFRVLVTSVGTAAPSAAASVAKGLGLPPETVISRLYRAPTALVDGISESQALQMTALLNSIGYEASAELSCTPLPSDHPLYDVSAYLLDASRFNDAVSRLANFVGVSEFDASEMLLKPPSIVLGSVSQATVSAFERAMGSSVSVIASETKAARYALFLLDSGESPHVFERIRKGLREELNNSEIQQGLVAMDVPHDKARSLWQRYQASGLLRIVNQSFLRFDITLIGKSSDVGHRKEVYEALSDIAGIPSELHEQVLASPGIRLSECIPEVELEDLLSAYNKAGLSVQAELITYQSLTIRIHRYQKLEHAQAVLRDFNLSDGIADFRKLPLDIPVHIPEIRARVLEQALQANGVEVELID